MVTVMAKLSGLGERLCEIASLETSDADAPPRPSPSACPPRTVAPPNSSLPSQKALLSQSSLPIVSLCPLIEREAGGSSADLLDLGPELMWTINLRNQHLSYFTATADIMGIHKDRLDQ